MFESRLASVKSFVYLLARSSHYAEPRKWFMLATNPRERLLDYAGTASTIRGFARRFLAVYCPENENYPSLAQTILREIEAVCFEETPEPAETADPHLDANTPDPTPAGEETETMTRLRMKKPWWRRKTVWFGILTGVAGIADAAGLAGVASTVAEVAKWVFGAAAVASARAAIEDTK